jgi:ABC-type taurine transport system ATPase subunit
MAATPTPAAPELLAPAGDAACVRAAIENGADAVYFGLDAGFNARERATNFAVEDLPGLMQALHRRGLKGYATLNTLVFSDELAAFARLVEAVADARVDAVLVQDVGAARLVREIRPQLALHASTQMTLTSAETIALAERLGMQRVVIARELGRPPKLLIAYYPARGLDVSNAEAMRRLLLQARNDGAGILLVSEDLDELFALSDRLVVMYHGQIVGTFRPHETDAHTVGHLMTGGGG